MSKIDYEQAAKIFKLFSHPTRLLIVVELLKGRKCVSGINELVKVRQPNISQHLSLLRLNGIVESKQNGKEACYCLRKTELVQCLLTFIKQSKLV
ncbi:MAG: metalloregulator ArsR/SmtB family transcription factor [Candidatus Theseobacter exili]|nr:metalloregulator ArsR/SmtB family transcription factor [Candidatus Theseobacter exili]